MKSVAFSMRLPLRSKKKKERVFEVDFCRGVAIVLMVLIHACYALGYGATALFYWPSHAPEWILKSEVFFQFIFLSITQPDGAASGTSSLYHMYGYNMNTNLFCLEVFFAGLFIFLCGISCSFSRSNHKRAIQLSYVSILLTITLETISTFVPGFSFHIWFGILNSLSFALVVYCVFDHFCKEYWKHLLFVIPLFLINAYVLLKAFPNNVMAYYSPTSSRDFASWAYDWGGLLVGRHRFGDDYFSPFLVTLVLFLGGIVGKTLYKDKKSVFPRDFPTKWANGFLFFGRHTLLIYLVHQVLIFLVMGIVFLSLGARIKGF